MNQRYLVTYAKQNLYAVIDRKEHRYKFTSASKSECIAKSQELNGFSPIDGNEQTYARQVVEYNS